VENGVGTKTKKTKIANDTRASICQTAKKAGRIDILIGLQLRKIRQTKKVTLEEVACGLQMSYQQVQKYEAGRNRIAASTLLCMAALLDRPVEEFFSLANEYIRELKG